MTEPTSRGATDVKARTAELLDRGEDPGELLDYAYARQLEDLQSVRNAVVGVATAKTRLKMRAAALAAQSEKLDDRARQAMSAGREDLALAAIERKQLIGGEVRSLDQQVTELEDERRTLTDSEQRLRAAVEAFCSNKEVLKAHYSTAAARARISDAALGVGDEMADVELAVQRAFEKAETMKARASVVEELQAAGAFEDLLAGGPGEVDIDRHLERLGVKSAVDEELAALKAELESRRPDMAE
jgi:phage shock protein A